MGYPLADSPRPWLRPLAVTLAAAVVIPAALFPLVPADYRPWNFAAFGAVGLFVAARGGRLGLVAGVLLALAGKLFADLLDYSQHGGDPRYLPSPVVYGSLALYAVIGWLLLSRSRNPLRVVGAAFAGSLQFFLVTNFAAWLGQSLPYDRGPLGLLESYTAALPFWRGTLLSDLAFTGVLFGLHAVLAWRAAPAGELAAIPVEDRRTR